ncbi:MAG TPA: CopD family protein [Anaerolineales bacterium]|nr:CopD family protein [Anaerolineales bacterium]
MNWTLALAYFFHLLATVVWVGGVILFPVLIIPTAQKHLPSTQNAQFLLALQKRFSPWALSAIVVLAGSGLMQMSAHPQYRGVLQVDSTWAWVILLKHIAYLGMTLLGAIEIWGILPALGLAQLRLASGQESGLAEMVRLQKQVHWLYWGSLLSAVVVLACTAVARVA